MAEISYKPMNTKLLHEDVYDKEIPNDVRRSSKSSGSKPLFLFVGTFCFIILYLSLSICLTFYQKWILKTIKFPLTIVMYHLISKLFMAFICRCISKQRNLRKVSKVDLSASIKTIAPTGIASGIDIGFSNWGLELVTVSLYTMTKSSTVIFILFFAILLGLEKRTSSLIIIVGMIAGGLFMFTYKSTSFDVIGFSFLLFASMASGVRWSLAQVIMQSSKMGLHNPVDMMFYMQPWMIFSLLPFVVGFEGPKLWLSYTTINLEEFYYILALITLGGIIAFAMEISEYLVLSHTSSLTLSISGIFKEICQLVLAVELNGDNLSSFNVIGLILCLGGICCHVIHKYVVLISNQNVIQVELSERNKATMRKNNVDTVKQKVPLLNENINDSDSDDLTNNDKINSSEVIFDILKRRDSRR